VLGPPHRRRPQSALGTSGASACSAAQLRLVCGQDLAVGQMSASGLPSAALLCARHRVPLPRLWAANRPDSTSSAQAPLPSTERRAAEVAPRALGSPLQASSAACLPSATAAPSRLSYRTPRCRSPHSHGEDALRPCQPARVPSAATQCRAGASPPSMAGAAASPVVAATQCSAAFCRRPALQALRSRPTLGATQVAGVHPRAPGPRQIPHGRR